MNTKGWDRYAGRSALISGGASGIGFEFARLLARSGWELILTGRNMEKLERARTELGEEFGAAVDTKRADLSDPQSPHELYRDFGELKGGVFLLINNAGSGLFGPFIDQSPAEAAQMLSLNITGLTLLSLLFGKRMAEAGEGFILNVGSLAGRSPMPFFAAYGASKSYVRNFSLALRAELKPQGVRVCCLEPGYVRTSFDENAHVDSEAYRKFSDRNAMTAEQVAAAGLKALFCGRPLFVPGIANRLLGGLTRILPPTWTARIVHRSVNSLIS